MTGGLSSGSIVPDFIIPETIMYFINTVDLSYVCSQYSAILRFLQQP